MVIHLPNNSLSEDEEKALSVIHEQYLLQKNTNSSNSHDYQILQVNSSFPNATNNDIMPTLIKLSIKRIIRLFSDKRFMVESKNIPYIEKCLKNSSIHKT